MQSRVSVRFAGRSPVERSHFVFHRNISLSYSLSCRSDRSCTPLTSYLGCRCLILVVFLGEDTGLGSDPPVISHRPESGDTSWTFFKWSARKVKPLRISDAQTKENVA